MALLSEKALASDRPDQYQSDGSGHNEDLSWTEHDETQIRRKIDLSVLPLLFLGLLVFQLDRMNLASALTGGFATDISVDQNTINLGNQLMFLGIVILEVPANMLLQKVGPRRWIAGQVLVFGFVATLQVFIRDRSGFLAARMCLGLAEAGYIPGACYTLSTWYKRRELAKRVAIFFFGMFLGNAISPLLASGILNLDHRQGLRGWQWLFLLEGVFTMVVAILLFLVLPASPDNPKAISPLALIRFSASDQEVLQRRLETDNPERRSRAEGMHIPLSVVWKTVSYWRRWPHFISTFAVFSTWSPLTTYTPTIIMALGFDRIAANALAAVGASLALVVVFIFAFISDKTNKRGFSVVGAQVCYLIALILARELHGSAGKWTRWGLWTLVNAFAVGYHPVHNSWVQLNCRDPRERSISIAMWVMSAISGLMVGTQYYRGEDTPFYNTGLRTQTIMVAVGILFALIQTAVYRVHNQHVSQGKHVSSDSSIPFLHTP